MSSLALILAARCRFLGGSVELEKAGVGFDYASGVGFDLSNAVIAIVGGLVVGVVLFVPFVALSYRHRGRLTFWRLIGWAAGLVYFVAIWSYTLLPLPDRGASSASGTTSIRSRSCGT